MLQVCQCTSSLFSSSLEKIILFNNFNKYILEITWKRLNQITNLFDL